MNAVYPVPQILKMTPGWSKLVEVILFLIGEAEARQNLATQYQIVKAIFVADTTHIEQYGRPVTFSNYAAMPFGPVPSEAYNMLKPNFDWQRIGLEQAPWNRRAAPAISRNAAQFSSSGREPNLRVLSETDREQLSVALKQVQSLGFDKVKDFTHKHPAYVDAWREGETAKSFRMNYLKMLPGEDKELLSDIIHASHHPA